MTKQDFLERQARQLRPLEVAVPAGTGGLVAELRARGVEFGLMGLRMTDDLPEKEWVEVGRILDEARQKIQWCFGDWGAFGLAHYDNGRTKLRVLQEFAKSSRTKYQTIANWVSISRAIDFSRRRENLDYSIHVEVAPLSPREQSQWLKKAEEEQLTVSELRQQIRISQGEHSALVCDGPVIESGTRYLDGLMRWLHGRPDTFWTYERRGIWKEKLAVVTEFANDRLN